MHYTRLRFCKAQCIKSNSKAGTNTMYYLLTPFGCFILYNHYHLLALPLYKHHQPAEEVILSWEEEKENAIHNRKTKEQQ